MFSRLIQEKRRDAGRGANLHDFFLGVLEMKYFPGGYQNSPHEEKVMILLRRHGFQKVESRSDLRNGTFAYQPYGNNKNPDFLVQYKGKQYNIECKTSKGATPVYNGGLPKPDYIYIFSSQKYNETTIYYGRDILSDNTRKEFSNLVADLRKTLDRYKKKIVDSDRHVRGFSFYIRNMYTQAGTSDKTDYFYHADRQKCEARVLDSVR
jgi:hypothetical protein